MKAELLILGVLHRGNFHPYEIKRRLRNAMVECYTSYGYRLIELPCVNVKARVRFVMDALDAA